MSIYCVGDLHGRYDLFIMLLEKINFNPNEDKMYILGDVIDRHYGGIQIINHLMQHNNSFVLLLGNHEYQFLNIIKSYDLIMFTPKIKEAMKHLTQVYSKYLFSPIEEAFSRKIKDKDKNKFYTSPKIINWLHSGNNSKRQILLEHMINVVELINYDKNKYNDILRILHNMYGFFDTKNFVLELLNSSTKEYIKIKEYINKCERNITLNEFDKNFYLVHSKYQINLSGPRSINHPIANSQNIVYIFGHDPVPLIHRQIQQGSNSFDFDYRKVYSWIDMHNNRYYNLDLSSNPIVALKLDDMSEYYVGNPSNKANAKPWKVPHDTIPSTGRKYYTTSAKLCSRRYETHSFITSFDGCYEFLIAISTRKKHIYYTPIAMLDYIYPFVIENWYDDQSFEIIIDKVIEDFKNQLNSPDTKKILKLYSQR